MIVIGIIQVYHLNINEGAESFSSKSLNISGMDDLFLNRMLFEWLRDR